MRGVRRIKGDNGRARLKGRYNLCGRNLRMLLKDEAETKAKVEAAKAYEKSNA